MNEYYSGDSGQKYFRSQNEFSKRTCMLEKRKLARYIQNSDSVLEVGCGGGNLLDALDCVKKIGIEVNPHAREHARGLGLDVWMDLDEVQDSDFTVVLLHHSLEHTDDPLLIIQKCKGKLRTGGRLVCFTPFDSIRRFGSFRHEDRNQHLFTWSPQNIGNLLHRAEFLPERIVAKVYTSAIFPFWMTAPKNVFLALMQSTIMQVWAIVRGQHQVLAIGVKE
ncbi:MAG: class I SAM-dependent methyltransferase [Bryobacteraceae bacterium]|nr:class I SAM-dependent methyltransferase [Bryobacteraceae bacterium]